MLFYVKKDKNFQRLMKRSNFNWLWKRIMREHKFEFLVDLFMKILCT